MACYVSFLLVHRSYISQQYWMRSEVSKNHFHIFWQNIPRFYFWKVAKKDDRNRAKDYRTQHEGSWLAVYKNSLFHSTWNLFQYLNSLVYFLWTGKTSLVRPYLCLVFQYCCDSDGEDEVVNLDPIYESSKSYHHRQLPDIIGTTDFLVSSHFLYLKNI